MSNLTKLLTTKQLPAITGLSTSWFEKARTYGYGPKYIKIGTGKVLYRPDDIARWLAAQERDPEGGCDE
jgi:predicted DNA-binding transcriptional regulator AlpA